MEHHKVSKLLNNWTVLKFVVREWIEVNSFLSDQYSVIKNMRFKNLMLRLDFCNFSDAYIIVKGAVDLVTAAANEVNKAQKDFEFNNNSPSRSCI